MEQGPGHSVQVGYQKGADIARQNLVFTVRSTPGTASKFITGVYTVVLILFLWFIAGEGPQFDYTLNTLMARALFSATAPVDVVVTFRVDSIAQERNETFTLTLIPGAPPTPREGLFFQDTIQMSIVDSDGKRTEFSLHVHSL